MERQSSIFRPDRLSRAFTSTLTSVVEKLEGRKSSAPTYQCPLSPTIERYTKAGGRFASVQEDFDSAIPVEAPTEDYLIQQNKYPAIRALRTDSEIGDGIWRCCHCRHENIVTHYRGAFPFKYLTCNRCDRPICSQCHSSEIISPLPYGMIQAPRSAGGREVRYFHLCTECGLSHRAEMEGNTLDFYGVTCAGCGSASYGDWPRYHIGNNEPYRRDPNISFAKLIDATADDAARLAFRWVIANQVP
ncbi:hypothetical protein BDW02DRAFT_509197 [Decorospora gaudefroyi]|uniref:Probable double zinc ribbon domain-containing protein n=1 Tax=Decorospora gaudefroyi TaxID=184978 RepID=A0A6A5K4V2_9PLEO|nr:hypothetical protein BDW02DRAFT_509197 [Decorospora gaudefroyi]